MPRLTRALVTLLASGLLAAPGSYADEQLVNSLNESQHSNGLKTPTRRSVPTLISAVEQDENSDAESLGAALSILGHDVPPGSFQRLYWTAGQAVAGLSMPTPVLVAAGTQSRISCVAAGSILRCFAVLSLLA